MSLHVKKRYFTKQKYNKVFIISLIGWVVALVDSIADSIIAGIFLDEMAVSAVNLVTPIYTLILFMGYFICNGTTGLYSRELGRFDKDKAYKLFGQGVISAVMLGIVIAVLMVSFREQYFNFYGASGEITQLGYSYYNWYIAIGFSYTMSFLVYMMVGADGDVNMCVVSDCTHAIVNAVVSGLLCPRIGIAGLGIGTFAAQVAGFIVVLPHFGKKINSIRLKLYFGFRDFLHMLRHGSCGAMSTLYAAIVDIVMNKFVIEMFGDSYIPAYGVINIAINMGLILFCSSESAMPFFETGYGENNPKAIKRALSLTNRAAFGLGLAMTVIMFSLGPFIPSLYGISDPQVYSASVFAARAIALTYVPAAFCYAYNEYYPCIERVRLGHIIGFTYQLAGPVIFPLLLAKKYGFNGLSFGFALTPLFAFAVWYGTICIMGERKKFPAMLPETESEIHITDLLVCDEDILLTRDRIGDHLRKSGIETSLAAKIELMVEEVFMLIKERNELERPGKKIYGEATIIISDKDIRLVIKDSGVIFDITDSNAEIKSMRCYTVAQMMQKAADDTKNLVTISFNRNAFTWER